jgi:hypothetical protein
MKIILVFKIFWFHDFDLFQVKVQLIFKCEVDYIMFLILDCLLFWYETVFDFNLLKIILMILVLEYVHISRRSHLLVEISRNKVVVPEGVA